MPAGDHPEARGGPGGGAVLDAAQQPAGAGRGPLAAARRALQRVRRARRAVDRR